MLRLEGRRVIKNNRLVIRVWDKDQKRILSQGKRVAKDCPLSAEERRAYVKGGAVAVFKLLKAKQPSLSIYDITDIIRAATGGGL